MAAKSNKGVSKTVISKNVNRPGVHSKKKSSLLKSSKNYKKAYVGQGK